MKKIAICGAAHLGIGIAAHIAHTTTCRPEPTLSLREQVKALLKDNDDPSMVIIIDKEFNTAKLVSCEEALKMRDELECNVPGIGSYARTSGFSDLEVPTVVTGESYGPHKDGKQTRRERRQELRTKARK